MTDQGWKGDYSERVYDRFTERLNKSLNERKKETGMKEYGKKKKQKW